MTVLDIEANGHGSSEWLRGVTVNNGVLVAVGENGTILYSNSGTSWSHVPSGISVHLNRVRYCVSDGVGQFVAVGNGGVTLASESGDSDWTSLASGTTNNLFDVAANDTGIQEPS